VKAQRFQISGIKWRVALPEGKTGFEANIGLAVHPDIHREDAARAIAKRIEQSSKDSKGTPTIEKLLERLFVASLAARPRHMWSVAEVLTKHQLDCASDGKFSKRIARVKKTAGESVFGKADNFILKNWRCLRFSNPDFKNLPGLQDWSPEAAVELMIYAGVAIPARDAKWYKTRRERLGLPGKHDYPVIKATRIGGGKLLKVETRD
jgi:hypothetical protein